MNFQTPRLAISEEDLLSSPSSDEKMDTGSESLHSTQNTPNSTLSDSEDRETEVLRLQNPNVLRLSEPEKIDNNIKSELNESLISRMSMLTLDSPNNRPKNLGISPPRLSSTLTSTTDHPLMGIGSPDGNFPDVVPKKIPKIEEDKDLSLSSIEDERGTTNGYEFYSPQRNTSKNNLYFTENFVTADSQILSDSLNIPPDVARVRRKIVAKFSLLETPPKMSSPKVNLNLTADINKGGSAIKFEDRNKRVSSQTLSLDVSEQEEFHSAIEWCESPPKVRAAPNFELPIEMSSNIVMNNDPGSPDVISTSTQEDKSLYQALLDPYTGSVALRHTPHRNTTLRRKVQPPPEDDDCCSLESLSGCSMESEDEPPPLLSAPEPPSEEDNTKRSKSTNTASECSDPIPEYSAADEFRDERSWLSVPVQHGGGRLTCDMKVIEPFKRVVSHGGYSPDGAALIVFSACHLPDNARPDYKYVMDNLFLYVMWSLERLVTDDYVLVYLHGSAGRRRMPSFAWLHECYKLVDRRLRKSLKHLYLVHPTFWLKSFVIITKPFVSSKFFRKLTYVKSLDELLEKVPVEPNAIPDSVKQFDAHRR